jgi:hypothetical protein
VAYLRHEQDLDLQAFGVQFQNYFLESSLYSGGKVNDTVARLVAERLGFLYVNSGAMYRAFTWLALERGIDCADRGAVIDMLAHWLKTLTGMGAVAMSPKAGAHGELCGMMAIKAAIAARGEGATRKIVLVPESAHGTNPATAALIGFIVKPVPADVDGTVHMDEVKKLMGPDVAAIMLTNPNTCGIFEKDIIAIAKVPITSDLVFATEELKDNNNAVRPAHIMKNSG